MIIQEQVGKDLAGVTRQPEPHIDPHGLRIGQGLATREPGCQVTAAHLQDGLQVDILGGAQSLGLAEGLQVSLQQRSESAKLLEQSTSQVDGRLALDTGAQKDRQQFGI